MVVISQELCRNRFAATLRSKPSAGDLFLIRFRGNLIPPAEALKQAVHGIDPQMLVLPSTLRAQLDEDAEHVWLIGKMLLFVARAPIPLSSTSPAPCGIALFPDARSTNGHDWPRSARCQDSNRCPRSERK